MSQFSSRKGIFLMMLVMVTAVMIVYLVLPSSVSLAGTAEAAIEPLTVEILKVGKADAIILQCGGETMVIDAGEEEDGQEVVDHLTAQGIDRVDVLIITHFDKDHVGGADTVAEALEIGRVLIPDYTATSTEYLNFLAALERKGIRAERLTENVTLQLGSAEVLVEPPTEYWVNDGGEEVDNDCSLITTVVHGSMRLVFTGDIEKERILQWLETGNAVDCDFLKVPHHGIYNTALEDLFRALLPEYAAICSSKKNPADTEVVEMLKNLGADVLETQNGDITVISNGTALEIHQS